jgi:hypothetical protein
LREKIILTSGLCAAAKIGNIPASPAGGEDSYFKTSFRNKNNIHVLNFLSFLRGWF